jgi:hypothetical protein
MGVGTGVGDPTAADFEGDAEGVAVAVLVGEEQPKMLTAMTAPMRAVLTLDDRMARRMVFPPRPPVPRECAGSKADTVIAEV